MPRSNDGRWAQNCAQCGKSFSQRRPDQKFCSQDCSNKAFPGAGGRTPTAGLEPRTCPVCDRQFQPYRDNQVACSRECYRKTEQYREVQQRNDSRPERRERKNALRRSTSSDASPTQVQRIRTYNREQQLAKYGLTTADYDRKLVEQGGVCMICDQPPTPGGIKAASKLHADHDHASGRPRDLLCNSCNNGIGRFRDDPVLLRAAADYIERHRAGVVT